MVFALIALAVVFGRPLQHTRAAHTGPRIYRYEVVESYPHDPGAFTQGLEYELVCTKAAGGKEECTDQLLESTGMYHGQSSVRRVDLATGKVLEKRHLGNEDFAEGLARLNGRLYQLTWMRPTVYSYDPNDFNDKAQHQTQLTDGWGLTTDGEHLLVTDSSAVLSWVRPDSKNSSLLKTVRQVTIQDGGQPVQWVNELEYIDGHVWGNVWQTDCLAKIDPGTGNVTGWALLHGLADRTRKEQPSNSHRMDVLNGIAWDKDRNRLFVTGKYWPRLFEIKLVDATPTGKEEHQQMVQSARRLCIR